MNRNLTPKMVKAAGAKEAHGSILDPSAGALYVHMHRESGLAHRHYVLKPWQVRGLWLLLSRPMLIVYLIALVTWSWMASQAARVPFLRREVATLTRDAERLDTLTATLRELQARYDQVQQLLSAARAGAPAPGAATPPRPTSPGASGTEPRTISPETRPPASQSDTSARAGRPPVR